MLKREIQNFGKIRMRVRRAKIQKGSQRQK